MNSLFLLIRFHVCLNTGFNIITMYLNKEVAVRVAATLINAVVAAVVMIVVVGIGTVMSVNGTSTICSFFRYIWFLILVLILVFPFTPGGGLRSLGGTTRGL